MMGFGGGMRTAAMKSTVAKMIDSKVGELLTGLIAQKEIDLLEKMVALEEAAGVEHIEAVPAKEDRQEQLTATIEALVSDDVAGHWFETVGQEHLNSADDAREYLDLDGDEWARRCDQIVRSYREQGDDRPRSACVCDYVNRKFGVDVGWFVAHVVVWNDAQRHGVAQRLLLGNFDAVGAGIERVTEAIEEGSVDA